MGGAMLPSCTLAWGHLLRKTSVSMLHLPGLLLPVPWPCGQPLLAHTATGDSQSSPASLAQSLRGSPLLCPPRVSVSPSPWKFCNQIPLTFKVRFPGFLRPLLNPQVGKSVEGPRIFTTVWELLLYNCSSVCGSPTWQPYGGANGDLL